eukprot:UN02119
MLKIKDGFFYSNKRWCVLYDDGQFEWYADSEKTQKLNDKEIVFDEPSIVSRKLKAKAFHITLENHEKLQFEGCKWEGEDTVTTEEDSASEWFLAMIADRRPVVYEIHCTAFEKGLIEKKNSQGISYLDTVRKTSELIQAFFTDNILVVQGVRTSDEMLVVRMICRFFKNIKSIECGPGGTLVKSKIESLLLQEQFTNLLILFHEQDIFVHYQNADVFNDLIEEVQKILSGIEEDDLDDLATILKRSPIMEQLASDKWMFEEDTIYYYGSKKFTTKFKDVYKKLINKVERITVGPRAPLLFVEETKLNAIEEKHNCILGLGQQGDNVIVSPKAKDVELNKEYIEKVGKDINLSCESVMEIILEKKDLKGSKLPFGIELIPTKPEEKKADSGKKVTFKTKDDNLGDKEEIGMFGVQTKHGLGATIKAVGKEAIRCGVKDGYYLIAINDERVMEDSFEEVHQKIKGCILTV